MRLESKPGGKYESKLDRENTARVRELREAADFGLLSKGLFHDLMGPLTTISLCVETLKDIGQDSAESVDTDTYTKRMIRASEEMSVFLSDIKKYISGYRRTCDTHVGTMDCQTFCVNTLCEQTLKLWKYKIRDSNIDVKILERNKIMYTGVSFHFYQLFSNLLSNAIDACESVFDRDRKINITLAKYGKMVSIKIADNGIGMLPETAERIFEPFFSTKKAEKGSGIGLSIVRDIVERDLGGTIKVKSTQGKGTTFTIRFPQII